MTGWERSIVLPSFSLRAAMESLSDTKLQICLVVDEAGRLVGTLTDGDIRRALLNGVGMDETVDRAMNTEPVVWRDGQDWEKARGACLEKRLFHLPRLDDEGRPIGIEALIGPGRAPTRNSWVLLMAGGFGKRLGDLTQNTPKPMLPLGGRPILETLFEAFVRAGFDKFFISVHYLADQIKSHFGDGSRWGVTIRYLEEHHPLGTAGAIGLIDRPIDAPLIVANGDLMTTLPFDRLLNYHTATNADLTMCVREYTLKVPFGTVNVDDQGRVSSMVEKPDVPFLVNAAVYAISPAVLARIPRGERTDMPDLINQLIADKRTVSAFPIHEYWIDIGRVPDFHQAQSDYSELFKSSANPAA